MADQTDRTRQEEDEARVYGQMKKTLTDIGSMKPVTLDEQLGATCNWLNHVIERIPSWDGKSEVKLHLNSLILVRREVATMKLVTSHMTMMLRQAEQEKDDLRQEVSSISQQLRRLSDDRIREAWEDTTRVHPFSSKTGQPLQSHRTTPQTPGPTPRFSKPGTGC